MKIVVIGGTGLIGKKLIPLLRERGHEAVAASPASGVNTLTGEAIDEVLADAAPLASTRVVTTPLVVGAGLLGLDHLHAPASAKKRLRATTRPWAWAMSRVGAADEG